jgi:hypothetical protein
MKGKMMKIGLLVCVLLWLPSIIWAQEKPTSEEVKKVVDYYYQGKGQGAILMAHKLCAQIYEEGPLKYECQEEITGGQIQKGREVLLWMNYLVPTGDKTDIIIQFKRNNKVRSVSNFALPGALRYRIWKKIPTDKIGDWQVDIIQEMEDTDLNLGDLQYSVTEANQ